MKPNNSIRLIRWKKEHPHVSQEIVRELEETLVDQPGLAVVNTDNTFLRRAMNRIFKTFILHNKKASGGLLRLFRFGDRSMAILMGNEYEKCLSSFFASRDNALYFFDAWPNRHDEIYQLIKCFHVKTVFFSSKQVTEIFKSKGLRCDFFWVPEAIDPARYTFYDYAKKDIDVVQIGRKFNSFHEKIVAPLKESGHVYLYEQKKAELIFKTQEDFVDGLARTKISICFPSVVTHPERSGNISTMTVRYLQSMASKCLVVGQMPDDMKDLFDYTPIIEADLENPAEQLRQILQNFDRYIPLIEKNYETVVRLHSWQARSHDITRRLQL